tara:strand:+ start:749 stop:1831 length:1083 start_codon:yes stop_codon:yes gene_type:complete
VIKNISYISEIFLPSTSAYSIHVMKMCNEFSKLDKKISLFVLAKKTNENFHKIYKCKKKFKIVHFNIKKNNFFSRIFYAYKIITYLKKLETTIISRSIISALLLNVCKKKVILEIHHTFKGFTKFLFFFLKKFKNFENIKIIFISKKLQDEFDLKNKSIILDDAVDISDFNFKYKKFVFKNTCAYTGSFTKGKGIENILEISKYCRNINFDLYGDFSNSIYSESYFKEIKNVNYKGYLKYKDIPLALSKYNVLLLPYSKKVFVRSNNLETSSHMSPLKLFDYLSSKKIIIASKMRVYSHILNKNNSILLNPEQHKLWAKTISHVFNNLNNYNKIRSNAFKTAKKYTWNNRAKQIIKFLND